jgi:hypothetical protein
MAWSDAARRAAAEVRRAHAYARREARMSTPQDASARTTYGGEEKRPRQTMAAVLRSMRRSPDYGYKDTPRVISVKKAVRVAAYSTRLRNALKSGAYKRPVYYDTGGKGASHAAYLRAQRLGLIK